MKSSDFDLSPEELRRLGGLAADAVASHRESLESRAVFGKIGPRAALFDEPLPEEGEPFEDVLAFVRENVMPYPMGNSHPRFYGFINATADPVGILADFLASGVNPNCWGGDHAATHVETGRHALARRDARHAADLRGHPRLGRIDGQLHGPGGRAAGDDARQRARGRPGRARTGRA